MVEILQIVRNIVTFINSTLTAILPGKEEWAVLAIALLAGYKWKQWNWATGGWNDMAKGTVVAYILLKLLGIGTKLF